MMKQFAYWLLRFTRQRQWIEHCKAGNSYKGPNGDAIFIADLQEMNRILERLHHYYVLLRPAIRSFDRLAYIQAVRKCPPL